MHAQLNPLRAVFENSPATILAAQFHRVSSAQKIIDEAADLRKSFVGHDVYARQLTAAKHALSAGATTYDLAREYAASLKAASPYINEIEKLQKSLSTRTAAHELQRRTAGLDRSTTKYLQDLAGSWSSAADASARASLKLASVKITALEWEAQRPHIAMDAFQRATTWLNPLKDIQSVVLRDAERYRALYSVSQPLELLRNVIAAEAPNPFADYANNAALRLLETLRSIGIDQNFPVDGENEDAVDVGDDDLAPYAAIAQIQLANQRALDRALIEEIVSSLITAYQNLQSSRQKQIFQIYIYPILLSLIFSWINPYHDFIVKQKLEAPKPTSEKVVQQKARDSAAPAYVLESFRFVSAKSLSVRVNGKMRSPELGTLRFGQPVEIIRKLGYWTLVRYRDVDNEVEIQGWVLSRYLKKFR